MRKEDVNYSLLAIALAEIHNMETRHKMRLLYEEIGDFFVNLLPLSDMVAERFGEAGKRLLNLVKNKARLDKEIEDDQRSGVDIVDYYDPRYPERLKELSAPPVLLFTVGDVSLMKTRMIGVVGPREFTPYGKANCEIFTKGFALAGLTVVSGIARGVDGIAHRTTLEVDGKTIAVLPCGQNVIAPMENRDLYQEVAEKGLRISEYGLGVRPFAYSYFSRNRIISGISESVFVPEAAKKGGTKITMEAAVEQGKTLYAVPSSIYAGMTAANDFIKEGKAIAVTDPSDVLKNYGITEKKAVVPVKRKKVEEKAETPTVKVDDNQKTILSILEEGEKYFDEIVFSSGLLAKDVLKILTKLELIGVVKSNGNYYVKIPNKKV